MEKSYGLNQKVSWICKR